MEAGLASCAGLDWRAPWFEPWRQTAAAVCAEWQSEPHSLHAALNTVRASGRRPHAGVRFVPQSHLPAGQAYESYIFRTRTCPTRENLHDFFNGLCWLQFPQAKTVLNRLQAAQIDLCGTTGPRGPVRDAITLFDENGALLCAPDPLWTALRARDWQRLFVELRPLWRDARLLIFGHALLEKLATPRKALTAHVWTAAMPSWGGASEAERDAQIAGQITTGALAQKPFTPLPVMGVPDWCAENRNFSFYDDPLVFRPAGRQKNT